jgi:hypothetical protein
MEQRDKSADNFLLNIISMSLLNQQDKNVINVELHAVHVSMHKLEESRMKLCKNQCEKK